MYRAIKAEWIKIKGSKGILLFCMLPVFLILLLYLFQTYFADEAFQLEPLRIWGNAGSYSLILFTTLVRRIWGFIFGVEMIHLEFVDNRSNFFVQRTGRQKMLGSMMFLCGAVSFVVVLMTCGIPCLISLLISREITSTISVPMMLLQCVIVWFMTYGSILLGMLSAHLVRESLFLFAVVLTFELFPSIYPPFLLKLWDRLDGYIFISRLMLPLKEQLGGIKNFSFIIPEIYSGSLGLLLWVMILAVYTGIVFFVFSRKTF